jgi:hypothetical protein
MTTSRQPQLIHHLDGALTAALEHAEACRSISHLRPVGKVTRRRGRPGRKLRRDLPARGLLEVDRWRHPSLSGFVAVRVQSASPSVSGTMRSWRTATGGDGSGGYCKLRVSR